MSIIALEGFDSYNAATTASLYARWVSTTAGTVTYIDGPYGGKAWRGVLSAMYLPIPAGTDFSVGFNFKAESTSGFICSLRNSGETLTQISLYLATDRTIQLSKDGTTSNIAAVSTSTVTANQWHYLEWRVHIANSGGTADVYLDNELIISYSGDTQAQTGDTANALAVGGTGTNTFAYDNLWITDNADGLEELRIDTLYPISDDPDNNWTPSTGSVHYAMLDEVPANNDTDYMQGPSVGFIDLYGFTETTIEGDIVAVQMMSQSRKIDGAVRRYGHHLRAGALHETKTGFTITSSYACYWDMWPVNIATSDPWTVETINGTLFGLEVVAEDYVPVGPVGPEALVVDGVLPKLTSATTVAVIVPYDVTITGVLPKLAAASAINAGDPYFSRVKLLMHMDGTDAATTTVDSSSSARTVSRTGSVTLSSTQKLFGATSMHALATSATYFSVPDSNDWNLANATPFTVEGSIYFPTAQGRKSIVAHYSGTSVPNADWELIFSATNVQFFHYDNGNTTHSVAATMTVSTGAWHQVAADYDGTDIRVYVDGVMVAKAARVGTFKVSSANPLTIGGYPDDPTANVEAYIDEVRVTMGTARYASDAGYTPATSPFPNY